MQLMIDSNTDSARELELAGYFLLELSDMKNGVINRPVHDDEPANKGDGEENAIRIPDAPKPRSVDVHAPIGNPMNPTVADTCRVPPPPTTAPQSFDDDVEDDMSAPESPTLTDILHSAAAAATEYDSAGVPWDARIHQPGRAKKLDETWKIRKRLDPRVVEAVMAELQSTGAIKVPAGTTLPAPFVPPPPVPTAAAAEAPATLSPSIIQESVPSASGPAPLPAPSGVSNVPPPPKSVTVPPPPTNGAPPPPLAGPVLSGNGTVTFRDLMTVISGALKAKTMTKEQLDFGLQSVGIEPNELATLASRLDLIPAMAAYVNGIIQ